MNSCMSPQNTENGTSRRQLLKTSGQAVAGGLVLGSLAQSASADVNLDLESDFEVIGVKYGGDNVDGKTVDATTRIYRPDYDADLSRSRVRVARTVIELGASVPSHLSANIRMTGKNGAYLEDVGPGNTIPQTSSSYTVSTTVGVSGATPEASVSVSATEGITKSALHIDDRTRPSEEQMEHDYEFDGGLEHNHIVIDGTAVFDVWDVDEWDEAIDVDWRVNTTNWFNEPDGSYTYTHVEGDLS